MRIILICILAFACGCAAGPTKDYYSPVLTGQSFKKPITLALVENVAAEKETHLNEGYVIIGTSDYFGKYPEAVELRAQARRAGANHVIYSVKDNSKPGSWQLRIGPGGGWGGSVGNNEVHIVFLGK